MRKEIEASTNEKKKQEMEAYEHDTQDKFRKNIQEEYHYLIGIVENMDNSLKKIDAVDSLRHTVAKLIEEKNKYKFFNLNTPQTESLIEYMQRLQGNFDTYFDNLENILYSIKIKINSILNTIGDSDTKLG